jgi:hypothetical protein
MPGVPFKDDQVEEMLKRMRAGDTLTSIADDPRMPSIDTMNRWEAEQDERGAAITRARALGYIVRAEKAVTEARSAGDPQKGRLAFDAERWFLGKMDPRRFGDAVQLKHADADGEKLPMDETATMTRLASIVAALKGQSGEPAD